MLGGGLMLLVLMRSLRAQPYAGGAQIVVVVVEVENVPTCSVWTYGNR
jgi:hypothetical protein